jgi:hypothetical protein
MKRRVRQLEIIRLVLPPDARSAQGANTALVGGSARDDPS